MVCPATGFSQLKKLFLINMFGLRKLWVDEGAMPNLSELTIGKCLEDASPRIEIPHFSNIPLYHSYACCIHKEDYGY